MILTWSPLLAIILHVKLFLNRDVTIFEDSDTYAVSRLKFLVAGCQFMHVSVTVGSLAHVGGMLLYVDYLEVKNGGS